MKKKRSGIKDWLKAFFYALAVLLFVKTFLFEVFTIPTTSMQNTLLPGDVLLVNKLSYGPRTPITPLSVPFVHQRLPFSKSTKSYFSFLELPYWRLIDSMEVTRNDVIVFNYPPAVEDPVDHKTHYIKRCIALPGDKLEIKDKKVWINDSISEELSEQLVFSYKVQSKKDWSSEDFFELGINEGGRTENENEWELTMSAILADTLSNAEGISKVKEVMLRKGGWEEHTFPFHKKFPWNKDQFGPIDIPKKGDQLVITPGNIAKYSKLIELYEKNQVEVIGNKVMINGKEQNTYEVKMNYYFVLGDNRDNSSDSRFWGFVPENHIIGRASTVLYSVEFGSGFFPSIKWNRFLKKVI